MSEFTDRLSEAERAYRQKEEYTESVHKDVLTRLIDNSASPSGTLLDPFLEEKEIAICSEFLAIAQNREPKKSIKVSLAVRRFNDGPVWSHTDKRGRFSTAKTNFGLKTIWEGEGYEFGSLATPLGSIGLMLFAERTNQGLIPVIRGLRGGRVYGKSYGSGYGELIPDFPEGYATIVHKQPIEKKFIDLLKDTH